MIYYINFHSIFGWIVSDGKQTKDYVMAFLIAADVCKLVDENTEFFLAGLIGHLEKLAKRPLKASVKGTYWKNWGNEELILAGHSYDTPNTKGESRKELQKNIQQKVFFAGECANIDGRHGGINGAIDSAAFAATEIARSHFGLTKLKLG